MLVFLGLAPAVASAYTTTNCTTAANCAGIFSTGVPTTCVAGTCRPVAAPGEYCTAHSDCASYVVLGTNACTASCDVDAPCGAAVPVTGLAPRCCAGIPTGTACDTSVTAGVDPCARGLACLAASSATSRPPARGASLSLADRWAPLILPRRALTTKSSGQQVLLGGSSGGAAPATHHHPHRSSLIGMLDPYNDDNDDDTDDEGDAFGNSYEPYTRKHGSRDSTVCTKPTSTRWIYGVIISVAGSIVLNVGLNLQKYAFRKNEALDASLRKPVFKMPVFFVALSFAAQSLIAALGAVSLLSNAVAAPLINKEPFGILDAISITFISAGTVLVVLYSNHDETAHSLCALLAYYSRTSVIIYLGVMGGIALVLWVFIKIMESNQARLAQRQLFTVVPEDQLPPHLAHAVAAAAATGSSSALGGARVAPVKGGNVGSSATLPPPHLHTSTSPTSSTDPIATANNRAQRRCCSTNRWLQVDANSPALQYMLPFAYAGIGGVMGGLTVLFAKSAAELVVTSVAGSNQFVYYQTYLILGGIFVTGLGQVFYINEGLRRYDALLQIPSFYVVYTLCGIFSAAVYFDELSSMSSDQQTMFGVGVGLTFLGQSSLTPMPISRAMLSSIATINRDGRSPAPDGGSDLHSEEEDTADRPARFPSAMRAALKADIERKRQSLTSNATDNHVAEAAEGEPATRSVRFADDPVASTEPAKPAAAAAPVTPALKYIDRTKLYTDVTYRVQYVSDFLDFGPDDRALISMAAPLLAPHIPAIVDNVYKTLLSYDITAQSFLHTMENYHGQFVYLQTYLILGGIFVTGLGQVFYINEGLRRYDALLQIPSFYVVYTLCGIFSAAVYFDELSSMSSDQQTMFGVGVGLTFLGVLCLTGRLRSVPAPPPASPKPDSATPSDSDPAAVPAVDSDLEKSASFEVVHHRVVAVADKTVGARDRYPAPPPASPKPDSATLSDPDPVAVPAIDSDLEKSASFEVVHHRVVAVADKTVGARGGTMGGLVFRDD
ncbi:hypothetical protein AMAG_09192 [Allomyces macrogynus ATCC 38327]|uniref:Globin-sensor domain-containing protein n=1 Tax=Allomyces macrogynus (strain ATCC 38327) TaxID=578462 RepID=A0A0L0SNP1_ALLM3|nr:hypothetical protein AMAG_09192 [Allomyces macrogynus ATCC 38327]|eukprot:KNE64133.1 hypothetical protein AMAG_09192 [Allomyces macrogynus ATCC 38327]